MSYDKLYFFFLARNAEFHFFLQAKSSTELKLNVEYLDPHLNGGGAAPPGVRRGAFPANSAVPQSQELGQMVE